MSTKTGSPSTPLVSGRRGPFAGRKLMAGWALGLALAVFLAAPAGATKYAAEFLKLGVGARALGMGGSFVAISDDASAAYWNPAGLANLTQAELMFMHAEQFGSLATHDYIGYVQPLSGERRSAVGIGLIRFSVDDIQVTKDAYQDLNGNGQWDPGEPILTDQFRTDSDTEYGLLLSYARAISDRFSLGGNVKMIRQGLLGNSSFGMGLDLGAQLHLLTGWTLGARLADATTTQISWNTGERESVAPSLSFGFAYSRELAAIHGSVTAAIALDNSFEGEDTASQVSGGLWGADVEGGLEYWFAHAVALRIGSDGGNLTAGAGLRYRALGADYAYLSNPDLDATHRISASVRF